MTRKFKSQYEEFLIAEQELRKHFLRFNKFVKENKDKIERAQRKVVNIKFGLQSFFVICAIVYFSMKPKQ